MEQPLASHHSAPKRVLIVENDQLLAQALTRALQAASFAPEEEIISPHQSVTDILTTLRDKSANADVLYLDAQLVYRDYPDPSLYGGLQLLKHIRLSPSLERLSLLPVVVGAVDQPARFLRQAVDNVILFSPGCQLVELPGPLGQLYRALSQHRAFADGRAMQQAIRPFVLFTDADERARVHAYLNRAGVGKFLKEFAPDVLDDSHPRLQEFHEMVDTEVWLKKMYFLRSQLRPQEVVDAEESAQLAEACRGQRFILVDDDCHLGWSLGLRAGLFGDTSDTDDRLLCIDSYEKAVSFFTEAAKRRKSALDEWAKAETLAWEKHKALYEATAKRGRIRLQDTEREIRRAQAELDEARRHLRTVDKLLNESFPYSLVFLDLRLHPPSDEGRPVEALTGMKLLATVRESFPDVPVLVMTASEKALSAEKARELGASGYWIKGVQSGKQLSREIQKCMEWSEFRTLWINFEKVRKKEYLLCYEWRQGGLRQRVLGSNDEDRKLLHHLLEECLNIYRQASERDITEGGPWNTIAVNLGIVQEARYRALFGPNTGVDWWRYVPEEHSMSEHDVRSTRNQILHQGKKCTREKARNLLDFTLAWLLKASYPAQV
ncbi:MAG: response regulator [candidate division KSB1 bacterium]|nr:response regulator [candidate division KSB1 bacterium]